MKKITKLSLLLAFAVSMLVSCKKDSTSSSNLAAGKSQISCNVSGAVSASFSSSTLVSTATKSDLLINISGGTSSLPIQLMSFILPANITVGTHNLTSSDDFAVSYTNNGNGWAAGNVGDNFTIVVTKNDGSSFEGTFSGTLTNDSDETTVTITNGKIAGKF